ncbi:MAG: amino acid ABC transporter permease [Clostridiales bacterium]|nr:amino acid ABC transporter permease [Clostridiales bacterium]
MSFSIVTARLLESFAINGKIFIVTLALGLPLGLIIAFGSMSRWTPFGCLRKGRLKCGEGDNFWDKLTIWLSEFRPISALTKTFVWIIRGTPLMLQVIIVFYGPGLIWGMEAVGRIEAAIVAFVINYACYFSEIYRGGIESISVGQKEAGQVLGMTKVQIFFKVTLLQVIKRIVPPMGNEVITLVKDTSLANFIANKEILMMAKEYVTKGLIWPLFYSAVFFLITCGILTILLAKLEKKLSYFN